ncbi:hypothetical protein ASPWEDRAFT_25457 [Aspergillus wentii DTO 134E9]|uniref:Terpene synthase n=1 Tax=Aspergillus wentii DTO 134E9 TaxID=1073089 RepID=A0A1L9RXS2_ASPWE|nr:uncharacterized protein ASPWEDRAFT_25457 [Aspergillus wentii DTO 134E9]OJJ39647.1 hypothetical protein ASPWEDRAFT_25457 [Aspergillus wentii DTO 134E9]
MAVMQNLPEYERLHQEPVTRSCAIPLKMRDLSLQLQLPHYDIVNGPPSRCVYVISAHLAFKTSIQPEKAKDTNRILESCKAEVGAVNLFFPDIKSESVRICMAAWLAANCAVDDELEEMHPADGVRVLEESIAMLQADRSNQYPAGAVPFVLFTFRDYCSENLGLSGTAFHNLTNDICRMCQGHRDELLFRQEKLPNNLETYLHIRGRTMGIDPFFTLICSPYPGVDPEFVSRVQQLQSMVGLVVGLQNDLIGLEKDCRNGEMMNAVLVSLREQAGGDEIFPEVVGEICRIHNASLCTAMEIYQRLKVEVSGKRYEEVLPTTALAFAETHLKWCASAKRYQATLE